MTTPPPSDPWSQLAQAGPLLGPEIICVSQAVPGSLPPALASRQSTVAAVAALGAVLAESVLGPEIAALATAQAGLQKLSELNITQAPYNAVSGGSPAAATIQAALTASSAGGPPVLVPIGEFFVGTPLSCAGPISLRGLGRGAGPGAVSNTNCSQIVATVLTGDVLAIGPSVYGSSVTDLQFNSSVGQRTAGNAIYINGNGSGSVNANYTLSELAFNNQYVDIYLNVCGIGYISNTYHQSWKYCAIYTNGNGVAEGSTGFVNNNYFFGATAAGTAQFAAFYTQNGYFKFTENLVLGSQVGIWLDVDQFPAGAPEVRGNWFEEQDVASIYVTNAATAQKASMIRIVDNEFSVATLGSAGRPNFQGHILVQPGAATNWIDLLKIDNNIFRTTVNLMSAAFIYVAAGEYVSISNNLLEGLTGNATSGIVVTGAQPTVVQVFDNIIQGAFNVRYVLTANCLLRDFGSGLTAAEVNALAPAPGSIVWVADGNPALAALTGASTGCVAYYEGAAWKVLPALQAPVAGYGTPTGGSHQASFAAGAITLANLAAGVAQLIVDLKTQGLLSA